MTKVRIIETRYAYELADEVNRWLDMNSDVKVIDIKYSGSGTVPAYSTAYYSAMIIYKA